MKTKQLLKTNNLQNLTINNLFENFKVISNFKNLIDLKWYPIYFFNRTSFWWRMDRSGCSRTRSTAWCPPRHQLASFFSGTLMVVSHRLNISHTRFNTNYSRDLNNGLVQYSNGQNQSIRWMVHYSSHDLNNGLLLGIWIMNFSSVVQAMIRITD